MPVSRKPLEGDAMARVSRLLLPVIVAWFTCAALAQSGASPEQRTARYFDSMRRQPSLQLAFLRDMPKGGDLHVHLSGALYAENLIDYAVNDNLCVDRTTSIVIAPPCDDSCEKYTSKPTIRCAYGDHVLYNSIVDAWSMRNWEPGEGSAHDHFFATFDKFSLATRTHTGDAFAEAASRAAEDHLQYLELMHTADSVQSGQLGAKLGWDDDFARMRENLLAGGLKDIVAATSKRLDDDESKMHSLLKCGTAEANAGCGVKIRYLYQVLRGLPREMVFAQIVMGFELAQADPRFVGLNLVMPEDWYVPMHDFELHMKMLDYLHGIYPKVHISLHAGELAMGLVPPEGLRFHIRESVDRGHAERIGHGVSVMNEDRPLDLLREMARKKTLVEICLTSNDVILGVRGDAHPLPIYLRYAVPVALATDDEGVSRSDMTHEYLRAAQTYDFIGYKELKRMARMSLEHSFLAGSSLWAADFHPAAACANDRAGAGKLSNRCQKFLDANERAQMQWKLEEAFGGFEKKF
jgi:adenosine deaminase